MLYASNAQTLVERPSLAPFIISQNGFRRQCRWYTG